MREAPLLECGEIEVARVGKVRRLQVSQRAEDALGAPDDIAGLAVLLAGKAGAFITGQTLIADGGTTSGG